MLTFAHAWVLALAPLPLVVRWLPPRARSQPTIRVPFVSRLVAAGAHVGDARGAKRASVWLRGLLWLLTLVAVARPQWLEPPIERSLPTRDLLLLVDLSGSMDQQDFTNAAGQQVDRLTAVKEVLGDFLAQREGDRVGLVVFGNAPFLQVPFTTDLALCDQLLGETAVRMAGPRTALGDAIGLGIKLFQNSDAPAKTMIALTDGNDTSSAVPPAEASRVAQDRGITIHTVAIGDPTTVGEEKLDQESLQAVAEETGGRFFLAMDRSELAGIYHTLNSIETRQVQQVSYRPRQDLFFWPVAVGLLISLTTHAWRCWSRGGRAPQQAEPVRLRVDPQTFALETVEP